MRSTQVLHRLRRWAALLALLGILVSLPFAVHDLALFRRAYLTAFVAWLAVPLGCLALLLIYHLSGGRWGRMLGEPLEASARTLPLIALLSLPLLFDLQPLFPWARPELLAGDEMLRAKTFYLDPHFFVLRAVLYLIIWNALAFLLTRGRIPLADRPRQRGLAAAGAIVFALTASFAAIDWSMSLDPRFNSSTFGLIAIGGQLNAGLGFAILTVLVLASVEERLPVLAEAPVVGLGGLLQGAILLWAYLGFMQYLIVWSGDLPHNVAWYLARMSGGWGFLMGLVVLGHFVLPFFLLLSERLRHDWRVVASLAGLVLAAQLVFQVWQTAPAWGELAPGPLPITGALLAVGGLWLFMVLTDLGARSIVLVSREQVDG